jgi:hypothetical protein
VREHSPSRSNIGEEFAVCSGTDVQRATDFQKMDCDNAARLDQL